MSKEIRLNTTHFFIIKILNKRDLQQIAINHSSDIDSKDFMKIYKKYTRESYSFLVNDTTSTQDNAKLLQQLKSGFKRIINYNKYLSKPEFLAQNPNFNHLVKTSFQGVNKLFVLAFEDDVQRTSNKRYYLPNVEIKDYNVMIDGKNFFDQPIKNNN